MIVECLGHLVQQGLQVTLGLQVQWASLDLLDLLAPEEIKDQKEYRDQKEILELLGHLAFWVLLGNQDQKVILDHLAALVLQDQ